MFEAKKVNKKIHQLNAALKKVRLVSYDDLVALFDATLKPFSARTRLVLVNQPLHEVAIGGEFDTERVRQPISIDLMLSNKGSNLKVNRNNLDGIMYLLFQVLCHELVHKYQYQRRVEDHLTYHIMLDDKAEMNEDQEYLAEMDELDAYGHDLALELVRLNPVDPFYELANLSNVTCVTWDSYTEAFEGTEWSDIRKQLLKKTYRHLSQIVTNKEHYHA